MHVAFKNTTYKIERERETLNTDLCIMSIMYKLLLPFILFSLSSGFSSEREKSLAVVREINRNGPYLGLITVYPTEENAFFAAVTFENDSRYPYVDLSGELLHIPYFI